MRTTGRHLYSLVSNSPRFVVSVTVGPMPRNHETPPSYEQLDSTEPEFWRELDRKENEASRPPAGECVGRPVLMVAECFVGGDLQGLVDGCRELGMPEGWATGRPDIYSWSQQVRRTRDTGGWVAIGSGHQSSQKREWLDDVPMDLPVDFKRVQMKAFSPTPSVVVLIATFDLTDQSSQLLDEELRTDRFLQLETRGSATKYHSAAHRKGAAVRAERERVRASASTWLAQTFAGTMSRDFGRTTLPSVEFLTTRKRAPFVDHEDDRQSVADYRYLLSIDGDFDAWECAETPGWRIGMPWRTVDDEWTIVVGGLHDPKRRETNAGDGGQGETAPTPKITDTSSLRNYFDGLLLRFTAFCLLTQYEGAFGGLRDQLASSPSLSGRALRRLEAAQETLTTLAFDASLVANELHAWATDDRRWAYKTIEPKTAAEWKRERVPDYPTLIALFGQNIVLKSKWILDMEPRMREELTARSSLMATAAALRLQQIVLGISILALVVALVGLLTG